MANAKFYPGGQPQPKKMGYRVGGQANEVDAGTPMETWREGVGYGEGQYFDAPPPVPKPPPLQSAYETFVGQPPQTSMDPAAPASAPAAGAPGPAATLDPRIAQQQQQRAAMRDMLMGRIGEASKPVDANDPGIKGILATQRLSRQRAEERQRSQAAAQYAGEGMLDSGAFDTALSGIEQSRGEGESDDIAEAMGGEQDAQRQELQQLLQMALANDDAEAARTIQQQLATMQHDEGARQFNSDLGFRKSSFLDNLNAQMAQMNRR